MEVSLKKIYTYYLGISGNLSFSLPNLGTTIVRNVRTLAFVICSSLYLKYSFPPFFLANSYSSFQSWYKCHFFGGELCQIIRIY